MMRAAAIYTPFRLLSFAVILLMFIAICYAAYISIRYWSGIGV